MTFRKFENETKEEWKKRHSEFANWAQLLREAVDHHGSQMTGNEVLYHGINRQMFFASTIALFDGPLSTTKNENIAFGFANSGKGDEGLVIELSNPSGDPVRYFNCVWLSQYAHEDERFFLGAKLMIKNIKTATTGEDYIIYVEALNVIQHIFDGRQYTNSKPLDFERRRTKNRRQKSQNKVEQAEEEKMTDPDNSHQKSKRIHKMTRKTVIAMLKHELHRYAPDRYRKIGNMPKYIEDTLTFYCGEMTEVKLSWFALHGTGDGAYTFVTKLISDEECDLRWFKMNVLQMLFPNMKKLEVSNIYLCPQSLNAILGYCQKSRGNANIKDQSARPALGDEKDEEEMDEKSNCVLEEIVMYRPSKKDVIQLSVDRDGDNQMDTYDDRDLQELITKTVAEYQERFEACGWNMQQNHNIINIRRVS